MNQINKPAASNGKKAFATDVATGASLLPHSFRNTLLHVIIFSFLHYN
jgi:hypothetical protein